MKLNVWRVTAFLLLIAISVGFGFAFDAAATAIEKHRYPQNEEYAELIRENAQAYGIPEPILWAAVYNGSGFASNAQNGDRIGLMQLTPTHLRFVYEAIFEKEVPDEGMLYHPQTNLECGAAWLSYLYRYYGVWDLVFAAYYSGTETVDGWLTNSAYVNDQGVLTEIPDREIDQYVKVMKKTVEIYRKLYHKI